MKERVLTLSLDGAIEAFAGTRWKFLEVEDERSLIRLEKPVGPGESYVVELPYTDDRERDRLIDRLLGEDFIAQTRRITSDW